MISAKSPQAMIGAVSSSDSKSSAVDLAFIYVSSSDASILQPAPSEPMFVNQGNKLWSDRIFEQENKEKFR